MHPTLEFLPGKFHGKQNLMGWSTSQFLWVRNLGAAYLGGCRPTSPVKSQRAIHQGCSLWGFTRAEGTAPKLTPVTSLPRYEGASTGLPLRGSPKELIKESLRWKFSFFITCFWKWHSITMVTCYWSARPALVKRGRGWHMGVHTKRQRSLGCLWGWPPLSSGGLSSSLGPSFKMYVFPERINTTGY